MESPCANVCPEAASSDNSGTPSVKLPVLLVLLAVGAAAAWMLYRAGGPPGLRGWGQLGLVVLAALLACATALPPVGRMLARMPRSIAYPSPRGRAWTAACIGAIALVYLLLTARQQHRDLFPRIHDELSYTIQARMLSQGRLWQPQHELADFFETFHFLTRPVYGSIYFPGAALMNVPGIWLRQPSWFIPLLVAAMVIAMSYRVSAELVDGVAGLLVALLVLATSMFRVYSTMVMAQVPIMLLGLLMAWAWLRWRGGKKWRWSLAIGAFAGWAAITRPADALAFAIPIGLAMLWDLRHSNRKVIANTLIALLIGAFPFIELQAVFDLGVTGNPWRTPYVMYLEQNQPGSVFGSAADQMSRPKSQLAQKQIYFAQLAGGEAAERRAGALSWAGKRLLMTGRATLPCALLLALIPAGMLLARQRGRWAVLTAVPLYLLLYALNPFFLLHYTIPLTVAAALATVLGARAIQAAMPTPSSRRFAGAFLTMALLLLAIGSLPQLNARVSDEPYRTPFLDYTQRVLAQIPAPAVVLFRFSPGCNVHEEPVYNTDVTWPDDAPIIRAQDLGRRDGALLRYYALRQPDRSFYIIDRRTGMVVPLGNAVEAAGTLHVSLNLPPDVVADVR